VFSKIQEKNIYNDLRTIRSKYALSDKCFSSCTRNENKLLPDFKLFIFLVCFLPEHSSGYDLLLCIMLFLSAVKFPKVRFENFVLNALPSSINVYLGKCTSYIAIATMILTEGKCCLEIDRLYHISERGESLLIILAW
jgi:hypothetical protein